MNQNKYFLLATLFLYMVTNYAVTIDDVKKLNSNTFFRTWSQFLDQVLKAQQDPMSDENKAVYQQFVEQAQTLNLAEMIGNAETIMHMQKQIKEIEKRVSEEKNFFAEWDQFCESVLNEKQFPLSPENEETYQKFIQRAKDLNIEQSAIDKMHIKMSEINDKLLAESVKNDPEQQAARLDELEKKVAEMTEKLSKENITVQQNVEPVPEMPTQEEVKVKE